MITNEEMAQINKKILTRSEFELYRKEKHSEPKLITYSDYTPEKFLNAFNRSRYNCISMRDENKKNEDIPEFRLRKIYFNLTFIVVYVALALIIITRFYIMGNLNAKFLTDPTSIIMLVGVALIFFLPTLTVAFIIKFAGMPPFNAYLYGVTQFYRMANGQIAFADISKKGFVYSSMFDDNGNIFHPSLKDTVNKKHSEIREVYIPSKIISAKMTRNGILLESSGRFYGLRNTRSVRKGGSNGTVHHYEAWTEMNIDYRKEVIPVTWTNLDNLLRELQGYDNYIEEKPISIN